MKRIARIVGAIGAAALAACATMGPLPADRTAATRGKIGAAEATGAQRVPAARIYLQLAKDQSKRASTLLTNGDSDRARWLLMRAEADAELAIALASEDAAQVDSQETIEQVRALERRGGLETPHGPPEIDGSPIPPAGNLR